MLRKVRFKIHYPLGDLVVFAGVLRELHRCYPGEFEIEVESPILDFWKHSPYAKVVAPPPAEGQPPSPEYYPPSPDTSYVVVDGSFFERPNSRPHHMLQSVAGGINKSLGLAMEIRSFRGDATLSAEEIGLPGPIEALTGERLPYWIICNGGKFDRTVKWWPQEYYQSVVDSFKDKILFVQVGRTFDFHPRLRGTLDFRGWTDIRTLLRLVYHADGVVCPITSLMHLAAAVRRAPELKGPRPCVVIGGGIEPPHWTNYPGHRFLSTVGSLSCSKTPCWKSRTVTLGDGSSADEAKALCTNVADLYPACMRMITPVDATRAINQYIRGGVTPVLDTNQALVAAGAIPYLKGKALDDTRVTKWTARLAVERETREALSKGPIKGKGRGIVTLAFGRDYIASAWVMLKLARHLGCDLDAEVWLMQDKHWLPLLRGVFNGVGARLRFYRPGIDPLAPRSFIFATKPEVIASSQYQEVLWIDADSFPAKDPSFLFESPQYRDHGAVLWPEPPGFISTRPDAWRMFGLPEDKETSECQGGELLFDKSRVSPALRLACWCNRHYLHFYSVLAGDKDIFRLALKKTGLKYSMPQARSRFKDNCIFQNDFEGKPLFQHRVGSKLKVGEKLQRVSGFEHHAMCQQFLDEFSESVAPLLKPLKKHVQSLGEASVPLPILEEDTDGLVKP